MIKEGRIYESAMNMDSHIRTI